MVMSVAARRWTKFSVLKAVLYFLRKSGRGTVTAETPVIHDAILQLAQNPEYAAFLGEYTFDTRGVSPFSRELYLDLVSLEMAGHLTCKNPDLVVYELRPKVTTAFETYTRAEFEPEELDALQRMAEQFRGICERVR